MEKNFTQTNLQKKTINELKPILKSLNLSVSGNKNILVQRILSYQNKSNYLNVLPSDIQRQTLFSLDYPDVLNVCDNNSSLCSNKFWVDYIKNHYFIDSRYINLSAQEVAKLSHDILLEFWKKNLYPSWRVLPFIFEVALIDDAPLSAIINRIRTIEEKDTIYSFVAFIKYRINELIDANNSKILRFWSKEWNLIKDLPTDKKELLNYVLATVKIPTLYWSPQGLKELNFDLDLFDTFYNRLPARMGLDLRSYIKIIVFEEFGLLWY